MTPPAGAAGEAGGELRPEVLRELGFSKARLLIVDDDEALITLLQSLLQRAGYRRILSTTDPREALDIFDEVSPDLVVLDLAMPHLDGFQVMDLLRLRLRKEDYLPILVLTGDDAPETKHRALLSGARDFINKPFDPLEMLLRMRHLLEARFVHGHLIGDNRRLIRRIRKRTRQLADAQTDTLERLAQVVEFHDDATGQHTRRVGEAAARVARALGRRPREVDMIRRAAPLHDVGKIGVPDSMLLKPGSLTADEFEVVKQHTSIGARILSGGSSEYLSMGQQIALNHHERWDGTGYPQGLDGEAIPLSARIVAVVDVFDALTHTRPYRAAWSEKDAVALIRREAYRHFDPSVAEAFLDVRSG